MRDEENFEEHGSSGCKLSWTTQGRARLQSSDLDFLGEARAVVPWGVGKSLQPLLPLLEVCPWVPGEAAGGCALTEGSWRKPQGRSQIVQKVHSARAQHWGMPHGCTTQAPETVCSAGAPGRWVCRGDTGFQGWPSGLCIAGHGHCLCGGVGTASWWSSQGLDQGCELTKDLHALHRHC